MTARRRCTGAGGGRCTGCTRSRGPPTPRRSDRDRSLAWAETASAARFTGRVRVVSIASPSRSRRDYSARAGRDSEIKKTRRLGTYGRFAGRSSGPRVATERRDSERIARAGVRCDGMPASLGLRAAGAAGAGAGPYIHRPTPSLAGGVVVVAASSSVCRDRGRLGLHC
jgi:hypothetical protein